jgi:hypothetical protein
MVVDAAQPHCIVTAGMLFSAVIGYFVFEIVVAVYAGIWLYDENMYFAQGWRAQVLGGVGALVGVDLGWVIRGLTLRRTPKR